MGAGTYCDGLLFEKDIISHVDGVAVRDLSHTDFVALLKKLSVDLTVMRACADDKGRAVISTTRQDAGHKDQEEANAVAAVQETCIKDEGFAVKSVSASSSTAASVSSASVSADSRPTSHASSPAASPGVSPVGSCRAIPVPSAPPVVTTTSPFNDAKVVQSKCIKERVVKEGCVVLVSAVDHVEGTKADVIAVRGDGNYEVRVHGGSETKTVPREHCKLYVALGESLPRPITHAPDAPDVLFKEGSKIRLVGLRSTPELNGQKAEITKHYALTDRFEVSTVSGEIVRKVRRENVEFDVDS